MVKGLYRYGNNEISNKFIYLIVSIIFFVSNDSLSMRLFGENSYFIVQVIYFLLVVKLLFVAVNTETKRNMYFLIAMFYIIFLTMFLCQDFILGYGIQMISFLTGFMIVRRVPFGKFTSAFNKVLFYVALLSLILFTLFLVYPHLMSYLPKQLNANDLDYINIFFYIHYLDMFRNTGVFREPGLYMIYLNMGLIFELFLTKKPNVKYIIVFVFAILTTLSTAGYIVLALIIIPYVFKSKSVKAIFAVTALSTVVIAFMINNYELFEQTLTKFSSEGGASSKEVSRVSSIIIPLYMFADSPFLGVGLTEFVDLYTSTSKEIFHQIEFTTAHSTNTILNAMVTYGLIYASIIMFGIYKFAKLISNYWYVVLFIFVILLMLLSNEDIRYSLLFSAMLFYGLCMKKGSNIMSK